MKRTATKICNILMVLILALTVFVGVLPTRANAFGEILKAGSFYDVPVLSLPKGWVMVDNPSGETGVPGMYLAVGEKAVFMEGCPTTPGFYEYRGTVRIAPSYFELDSAQYVEISWGFSVIDPSSDAPDPGPSPAGLRITKHPTSEAIIESAGAVFVANAENYSYLSWYLVSPGDEWISVSDAPARFPYLSVNGGSGTKMTLYNIPRALNDYRVVAVFGDSSGNELCTNGACHLTVKPGGIGVLKNPTSETVDEGGSCSFVAHGMNYEALRWYLIDHNGDWQDADDAASRYPGLNVSFDDDRTALRLSHIPAELDGYRVVAKFTDSRGNEACSKIGCTLTVKAAPKPDPEPAAETTEATAEPSTEPSADPAQESAVEETTEPATEATAAPTTEPAAAPAVAPTVAPVPSPAPVEAESGMYRWAVGGLLLICLLLVVLIGLLIHLLFRKKK